VTEYGAVNNRYVLYSNDLTLTFPQP